MMKKILIRFSLLLFIGAFALSACKDKNDDDDSNPPPVVTSDFKAQVDGVGFTGDLRTAQIDKNNNLIIYSVDDQDAAISLNVKNFEGDGTYVLKATSQNVALYSPDTSGTVIYSTNGENGNGSLIVTQWISTDSLISGSFSFDAQLASDTMIVEINNGVFNNIKVKFSDDEVPESDNSFSVKIDGALWEQKGDNVTGLLDTTLTITASNFVEFSSFLVKIPGNIVEGSYDLGVGTNYTITYTSLSTTFLSVSGIITVISHDLTNKHIKAIFTFEGVDNLGNELGFTDGEFELDYP
jgi:hypothetical protein